MARMVTVLSLSLLLAIIMLPKKTSSQTRAMCFTQLSLASQACSLLPLRKEPRDPQAVELLGYEEEEVEAAAAAAADKKDHAGHHQTPKYVNKKKPKRYHFNDTKEEHRDRPDDEDEGDEEDHKHQHRRRRRHSGRNHINQECCWWLKELDTICVCEVLFLLPKFLTSPHHNYTVTVGETCEVTYDCGGF